MEHPQDGSFRLLTDGCLHTFNVLLITWVRKVPSYIKNLSDRKLLQAPEYALDEVLLTASDMYSLGCLIYAVHCKGNPPIRTHNSLSGLRENAGRPVPGMERLDADLQGILTSLALIRLTVEHCSIRSDPFVNHSSCQHSANTYSLTITSVFQFIARFDAQLPRPF
jgi:hypothetical protein